MKQYALTIVALLSFISIDQSYGYESANCCRERLGLEYPDRGVFALHSWRSQEWNAAVSEKPKILMAQAGDKRSITDLTRLILVNPQAAYYIERGDAFAAIGQYEKAISDYSMVVKSEFKNFLALRRRGLAYQQNGQPDLANEDLKKAVLLLNQRISDLTEAVRLNPEEAKYYKDRAQAFSANEMSDRALQDFNETISLNPNDAESYFYRGLVYGKLAQYDRAIKNLEKAIELNPRFNKEIHYSAYPTIYKKRVLRHLDRGYNDLALADLNKLIQINPKDVFVYTNRGSAFKNKGQYELAILDYNRAIQLKPKDATTFYNRASMYKKMGHLVQAVADYNRAIQLKPNDSNLYINRGIAYLKMGYFDHSIVDFNVVIALNSEDAIAYFYRGSAYAKKGAHNLAIESYTNAIDIDSRYADAYYRRGLQYRAQDKLSEALEDLNKAVALNPDNVKMYTDRANIYDDLQNLNRQ